MAGVTLAQAQAHLDAWLAADLALTTSQSYTIHNRTLTRADAREVRENIAYWEQRVNKLTRGSTGPRVRYGAPE